MKVFEQILLEHLDFWGKKWISTPLLHTIHKINFIWITDLNIKPKIIKLLGENLWDYHNLWKGNHFLKRSWKAINIKKKFAESVFMQIYNFCSSKITIKNEFSNHSLENIHIIHISDKRLISRTYGKLLKANNKKTNNPSENRQKIWTDKPEKKNRCPTSSWKDHHRSSRSANSCHNVISRKPQWMK